MYLNFNSPCSWRDFKLLSGELEYGSEGGVVGHLEHLVGQLRVGGEGDLEGDLGTTSARHHQLVFYLKIWVFQATLL